MPRSVARRDVAIIGVGFSVVMLFWALRDVAIPLVFHVLAWLDQLL